MVVLFTIKKYSEFQNFSSRLPPPPTHALWTIPLLHHQYAKVDNLQSMHYCFAPKMETTILMAITQRPLHLSTNRASALWTKAAAALVDIALRAFLGRSFDLHLTPVKGRHLLVS